MAEPPPTGSDRKSTRLNSSHGYISYAVFCLKKKTESHSVTTPKRIKCPSATHGTRCALCRRRPAASGRRREQGDGYSARLLHFFFNDTATTEIYTLSLHDALPI